MSTDSSSDDITIHIKSAGDKKYELKVSKSLTIGEFKQKIEAESEIPHDRQRLIYSGRVLRDGETLASYKVQDGHTIHLVKSSGNKPTTTGGSGTSGASSLTTSNTNNNNNNNIPTNISAGTSASDPLAGLTGARYAGYGLNLPSADMFGPDGGLNPSDDQISSMMDSPMFQEMMSSMLDNPQMVDNLINQNPMLRSMGPHAREILQSPYFRQMMSNPAMLRQAMDMQRSGGLGGAGNLFSGAAAGAGAGGAQNFPAPGPASNSESSNQTNNNNNQNQTQNQAQSQNPFAAMFPGGAPQLPPFGFFGQPPAAGANVANAGAGAGASNPFFNPELLASMLGGGAANPSASPADTRPPEERYEEQLRQLNDMGFTDFDRNVAALRRSGGSVQGAINSLLDGSI